MSERRSHGDCRQGAGRSDGLCLLCRAPPPDTRYPCTWRESRKGGRCRRPETRAPTAKATIIMHIRAHQHLRFISANVRQHADGRDVLHVVRRMASDLLTRHQHLFARGAVKRRAPHVRCSPFRGAPWRDTCRRAPSPSRWGCRRRCDGTKT